MNTQLITKLIQKRLTFPAVQAPKGNSRTLARQLDAALIPVGFKLSKTLLSHFGEVEFAASLKAASTILDGVKQLVGDHVAHNTYFKDFPKNVPDTLEFWGKLLADYYEQTGEVTNNLLAFPTYGSYQHSYEEMVEAHSTFKPKKGAHQLKIINLGGSEQAELENLCAYLVGSQVPLNVEDRALLEQLYKAGFVKIDGVEIPVRENRAIINGVRLRAGVSAIQIDTLVDALRVAAYLSDGDVTLVEKVKFKSLSRPIRRALIDAMDNVLADAPEKIEDINNRREEFKRLAERLHPFEFAKRCPAAIRAFKFAAGDLQVATWAHKVQTALKTGKLVKAIDLLSDKPGYLIRSIDQIARNASETQFDALLQALKDNSARVSGRVILSVIEHLDNRKEKADVRLFVNKAGTGFAKSGAFPALAVARVNRIQKALWKELASRIQPIENLSIDPKVATIAVPISEKNKSEGFRVLSRGSTIALDPAKNLLRFFVYWKQTSERTDYDLSVAFYDKDFTFIGQGSWTSLAGTGFAHSGDITSAPNGASEFINVDLTKIDSKIGYIVPTINIFSGETFANCAESFFGFMSMSDAEKGKPFEPAAVQMKFALRGDKKVGVPLVFARTESGFEAKWLDLYAKGSFWGNRVETTKFSTALLAKSLVQRQYLTCDRLLDLYRDKAAKIVENPTKSTKGLTYIGFERPEGIPQDAIVYTLDNLKSLIPA